MGRRKESEIKGRKEGETEKEEGIMTEKMRLEKSGGD